MIKHNKQSGFTIVELLLAMTFFSFILIFFSYGFIQINRTFQRGQTIKQVTQSGRSVIEDLSRNIRQSQYNGGSTPFVIVDDDSDNRLCLSNGVHYGWTSATEDPGDKEQLVDGGGAAVGTFNLVKSEASRSCTDSFVLFDDAQTGDRDGESFKTQGITSLLSDEISVQNLDFELLPTNDAVRIDLTLSADGVGSISTNGENAVCDGFIANGSEFCDVIRFVTTVNFRLR